jgi:hypothetical protein
MQEFENEQIQFIHRIADGRAGEGFPRVVADTPGLRIPNAPDVLVDRASRLATATP